MRKFAQLLSTCLFLFLISYLSSCSSEAEEVNNEESGPLREGYGPAEHFYQIRSFPDASFDRTAFKEALAEAKSMKKTSASAGNSPWTLEGPTNIGGRINAVAVDPNNSSTVLAGNASGGIFKTTNNGSSWEPIFDDQPLLAISDITYAPGNSQVIYAGTGDRNISGFPFIGDGVYKSTDGGSSWAYSGLRETSIISRVVVDHSNPNIVFAGCMGLPFERNNDRGLYRSTDAGATWTQVLFVSNQAGIIDLHMDPNNANILYASSWDRIRTNQESTIRGPGSKVWKSTDNGQNWVQLTNGLPTAPLGRVNLTVNAQNPNSVYAAYVDSTSQLNAIFVTHDAGQSWSNFPTFTLDPNALGGFGWYFGDIYLNPFDTTELYLNGVQLWRTRDNGVSWFEADPQWFTYEVHADKHDIWFNSATDIILATDGGLYRTTDGGFNWADYEDIPNTQFYRVGVNPHKAGTYYGGAQDNGTSEGNASILNAWPRLFGGDGFTALYDNNPSNVVYETQNGGIVYSDDGGNNIFSFDNGLDGNDRRNWDMPIILSSHDNSRYYTGTYRVYQNNSGLTNHNWTAISPDLTDGSIFGDRYHTLTAVEESPRDPDVLYATASDGNVHNSTNGGSSWNNVSAGLPKRYVTSIKASPFRTNEVFVTVSGYKYNDFIPHIHHSTDNGVTWTDISGDLPDLALNDVLVHPTLDSVLVVASDGGCYVTENFGQNWERIGNNMPFIPVYDMAWDTLNMKLIAGTHARSLMSFPMDSLVSNNVIIAAPEPSDIEVKIYPNPANAYLRWEFPARIQLDKVEIYSLKGELMRRIKSPASTQSMKIEDLAQGMYLLRIESKEGTWTRRIQKVQ